MGHRRALTFASYSSLEGTLPPVSLLHPHRAAVAPMSNAHPLYTMAHLPPTPPSSCFVSPEPDFASGHDLFDPCFDSCRMPRPSRCRTVPRVDEQAPCSAGEPPSLPCHPAGFRSVWRDPNLTPRRWDGSPIGRARRSLSPSQHTLPVSAPWQRTAPLSLSVEAVSFQHRRRGQLPPSILAQHLTPSPPAILARRPASCFFKFIYSLW